MLDFLISVALGILAFASAYQGFHVRMHPPTSDAEKKSAKVLFGGLGLIALVLIVVQGIRGVNAKDALRIVQERNTELLSQIAKSQDELKRLADRPIEAIVRMPEAPPTATPFVVRYAMGKVHERKPGPAGDRPDRTESVFFREVSMGTQGFARGSRLAIEIDSTLVEEHGNCPTAQIQGPEIPGRAWHVYGQRIEKHETGFSVYISDGLVTPQAKLTLRICASSAFKVLSATLER